MYGLNWEVSKVSDEPKFKVGQRVRFTSAVPDSWWFKPGEVGSIAKYDAESMYKYDVCTGDEDDLAFVNDEHIEPAFLPGDKVRVTKHSGYFAVGEIGVVEHQTDIAVYVKCAHFQRIGLPVPADALDLIEAAPAEAADCAERKEQQEARPEPKFKAGDLVEYTDGQPGQRTIKCVKTTYDDGTPFLCDERAYDYVSGGWDLERDIRLVAASGHCIVALTKNGQPLPATRPYIHNSVQAAIEEAERLARNNPGQEFVVYQRVAGRVAEVSYEMKEVA